MDPTQTTPHRLPQRARDELSAAVAFLTRLPVRAAEPNLARACWAFPIVGAMVGATGGLVLIGGLLLNLPPLAAALLALLTATAMTGALHEDGLADTADGLAGENPGRRLEIMRDSRIGAFGVLALVFSVGLRAAALVAIADAAAGFEALVLAAALSRGILPSLMYAVPLASTSGLAAMVGRPERGPTVVAALIAAGGAVALLGPGHGFGGLLIGALIAALIGLLAKRRLGGYNGDVLGAAQQCAETAVLLYIAAIL